MRLKPLSCVFRRRGETVALRGLPPLSKLLNPLGGLAAFRTNRETRCLNVLLNRSI